jgi:hypothetical protein
LSASFCIIATGTGDQDGSNHGGAAQRLAGPSFVAARGRRLKGLALKTIAELGVNVEYLESRLDLAAQRDLFQEMKVCSTCGLGIDGDNPA